MAKQNSYGTVTPSANDVVTCVDPEDTTQDAAGSTKKIVISALMDFLATYTQTLTGKTIDGGSNTVTIPASSVTSGTFADARISESSVTQHEGALGPYATASHTHGRAWIIPISNFGSDLVASNNVYGFYTPYAVTVTSVDAFVRTAPTGAAAVFDINEGTSPAALGASILSTKISIDAGEYFSGTAATPPVVSDASVAAGAFLNFDVDQIGSTIAGQDAHVIIRYTTP